MESVSCCLKYCVRANMNIKRVELVQYYLYRCHVVSGFLFLIHRLFWNNKLYWKDCTMLCHYSAKKIWATVKKFACMLPADPLSVEIELNPESITWHSWHWCSWMYCTTKCIVHYTVHCAAYCMMLIHPVVIAPAIVNTLRPNKTGDIFADDICKSILFNEMFYILIQISLKFLKV